MSAMRMNLIIIGIVLGLSGAFAGLLVWPGTRDLADKQRQVNDVLKEVQGKQQELGNVSELYASIKEMDQQTNDYRKKLPADMAFGEFLREVSGNLKQEGIEDFLVQPHPPQSIDETRLSESFSPARGTVILPVSLQFETELSRLFAFLSRLDRLPRLSNVESMTLINHEQQPGQISVELMLHTYHHPN